MILLGVAPLSGGLLVAGCARHEATGSGYAHPGWLVSADWVKQRRGDPAVRIVALTPSVEFAKSHIPGAAQIDAPALDLSGTSSAAVATWRATVEKRLITLGIRRNDTVVIYDGGTLFAARLWWVLDYLGHKDKRILDGGLPAWTAARDPTEQGQSVVSAAAMPYRGIPNPTALATLGEVKTDLGKVDVTLVDARGSQEYVKGAFRARQRQLPAKRGEGCPSPLEVGGRSGAAVRPSGRSSQSTGHPVLQHRRSLRRHLFHTPPD